MGMIINFYTKDVEEKKMRKFIGSILKKRIEDLGYTISYLAENTFTDESYIQDIIDDNISVDEIHEFDLELICRVLMCSNDYFINERCRNKDIINASMNRGECDVKSNIVKGRLQQFAKDYMFINKIIKETEVNYK